MRAVGLMLLSGCSFAVQPLGPSVDGGVVTSDAMAAADGAAVADAPPPAPDAFPASDARVLCAWEFTPTGFDPCALPPSNGVRDQLEAATLDSESGVLTPQVGAPVALSTAFISQSGATALRVIVFDGLSIGAPIRVVGSHRLLIVVNGPAEIGGEAGLIDVSAVGGEAGATIPGAGGDDPIACEAGAGGAGVSSATGGSAGGGGGYAALGGRGGPGSGVPGGGEGAVSGTATLAPLRGGCPGGDGGSGGSNGGAASGGAGGGALQISARGGLTVSGRAQLRAGGAGGGAGSGVAGGGGGGSGGGIFLEADRVRISPTDPGSVRLCANGGSGGEGGGGDGVSSPGRFAVCSDSEAAATPDLSAGGNGGSGGYRDSTRGEEGGGAAQRGGGGGGGSAGRIRIRSVGGAAVLSGAPISPAPTLN